MAFVGRTDVKDPGAEQQQWERLAQRRERLYDTDEQFREVIHLIFDKYKAE